MQPALYVNGQVVRCAYCRTDDYGLPDHPLGENHFSIRFGNSVLYRGRVTITLDGTDVTRQCHEAFAGRNGWVALYVKNTFGKYIVCANNPTHCLSEIHHGSVVVKRREARPSSSDA